MATTSPDNLRSPNPTDPYNLVSDWALSMSDVQAALDRRANSYKGTSAQRVAFTSAPEGTLWKDTDGSKILYVRQDSSWIPVAPSVGVTTVKTGRISASATTTTFTFSTPFPTGTTPTITTQVVSGSGSAVGVVVLVTSVSNTGFSARTSTGGPFPVDYIAMI